MTPTRPGYISCCRGRDEPRCLTCRHFEAESASDNLLAEEDALIRRWGDYVGLPGWCGFDERGAMSKAWCNAWEAGSQIAA